MAKWVLPEGRTPLDDSWFREKAQMQERIEELEAKLAKAVWLMEVSVEVAGWELDLDLRDEVIDFVTELKGEKDE